MGCLRLFMGQIITLDYRQVRDDQICRASKCNFYLTHWCLRSDRGILAGNNQAQDKEHIILD